jgi:hypothetical protein
MLKSVAETQIRKGKASPDAETPLISAPPAFHRVADP